MKYFIFILLSLVFLLGCEHEFIEPEQTPPKDIVLGDCDTSKVYFQNDILPILVSSCAFSGCHDAGTGVNGVVLTSYEKLISSDVVKAGDLNGSKIYERITETDINKRMPYGGSRLPQVHIDKIRQWIEEGAENSACDESTRCDTNQVTYSGVIFKIIQQKCSGCHRRFNPGGRIDLTTFSGVQSVALDQRLLNAVLHAPGYKAMPLGGQMLPDCEIEAIRIWISEGAPNN